MSTNVQDQKQRILKMIQEKFPNYHPILGIAEIANGEHEVKILLDANKAILPYVESQLKAIEVQGNIKNDFGVLRVVVEDDDEPLPEELSAEASFLDGGSGD